jgi:ubiquinone/menaquinone biosynthesis C-methylase UbiE
MTIGDSVADPATASLLALIGDVRDARVLDLGCGHGRVARELARRGARVIGIDISTALLSEAVEAEARSPLKITYLEGDAASSSLLEGGRFDSIACNYGLSDMDDLDGVLGTVQRLLTPGGAFVFSILHPCFPGSGPDAPSSWNPRSGYYHEGWWLATNPGFRGKVGSHARMLSTYLNSLVRQGLMIEEIAEPAPRPEITDDDPGADVPWYLVVRSRKR